MAYELLITAAIPVGVYFYMEALLSGLSQIQFYRTKRALRKNNTDLTINEVLDTYQKDKDGFFFMPISSRIVMARQIRNLKKEFGTNNL